jgi:hypothetical protein
MTFKEGIVLAGLMVSIVTMAITLMMQMNTTTILKVYTSNIHQFIDIANENKGVDFNNYKYKLNSRINCEGLKCSYVTEYKNEMIKNTDVVIQLKSDKTPEKIIYKFDAIRRADSISEETRNKMKEYYQFIERDLKNKNVDVYYSTKDDNSVTLEECFNTKDCLFIVKLK